MKWHQRFFWLLLALLPTQLGYHFWPEWAGVLGRRVDYLAPTIYLTDILLLLTLVTFIISNFKFLISKQIRIILPAVLFVVVNIFVATNQIVALYKWVKVTEFVLLGWYIVRTKPKFSFIITPLSIGVFYSSMLAIVQFLLQHSVGGPLWWLGERTFNIDTPGIARFESCQLSAVSCQLFLRPYATFPHPNVLGGFLAAVPPLLLMSLMRPMGPMSQIKKRIYVIVLTAGVIALILTFSRSAIVVGAVAIAVVIARMRNKNIIFLYSLFAIILLVSFMKINLQDESIVVRELLNNSAIKIWQSSPLVGAGLGNFLVRLPEALPSRSIYFLQPVHNIYLLLLSEVGIVGFGIIALWTVMLLKHESGIMNTEKRKNISLFIIHNSVFSILALGLVDHYPLTLQQGQLLFTVLIALSLRRDT